MAEKQSTNPSSAQGSQPSLPAPVMLLLCAQPSQSTQSRALPKATHPGRAPRRAWPAPHLPLWRRCLCIPEGGRAVSQEGQSPV